MRTSVFAAAVLLLSALPAIPCFDTYLFLNKYSLALPKGALVGEAMSEYSFNRMGLPGEDAMFLAGNVLYGLTDRLSIQVGAETEEGMRNEIGFGSFGVRGVYNLIRRSDKSYSLDGVLQHHTELDGTFAFEASAPNIFRRNGNTMVLHPTVNFEKDGGLHVTAGGHCGLFHAFGNTAIAGLGTEYQSAQQASRFTNRLVEGEWAASLFLGAQIGPYLFWQNEFAKGLANSRDLGFATTFKVNLIGPTR